MSPLRREKEESTNECVEVCEKAILDHATALEDWLAVWVIVEKDLQKT